MIDPIVEQTRKAGDKLFARHGNDIHAVAEYLRRRERESGRRVVTLPAKPPLRRIAAPSMRKKAG